MAHMFAKMRDGRVVAVFNWQEFKKPKIRKTFDSMQDAQQYAKGKYAEYSAELETFRSRREVLRTGSGGGGGSGTV